MRAIVIRPSSPPEEVDLPEDNSGRLRSVQGHVSGYIEAVTIETPHGKVTGYVNEDGKGLNLPANWLATSIYNPDGIVRDVIVGAMVILGPPDANCDDTSVPEGVLSWLQKQ